MDLFEPSEREERERENADVVERLREERYDLIAANQELMQQCDESHSEIVCLFKSTWTQYCSYVCDFSVHPRFEIDWAFYDSNLLEQIHYLKSLRTHLVRCNDHYQDVMAQMRYEEWDADQNSDEINDPWRQIDDLKRENDHLKERSQEEVYSFKVAMRNMEQRLDESSEETDRLRNMIWNQDRPSIAVLVNFAQQVEELRREIDDGEDRYREQRQNFALALRQLEQHFDESQEENERLRGINWQLERLQRIQEKRVFAYAKQQARYHRVQLSKLKKRHRREMKKQQERHLASLIEQRQQHLHALRDQQRVLAATKQEGCTHEEEHMQQKEQEKQLSNCKLQLMRSEARIGKLEEKLISMETERAQELESKGTDHESAAVNRPQDASEADDQEDLGTSSTSTTSQEPDPQSSMNKATTDLTLGENLTNNLKPSSSTESSTTQQPPATHRQDTPRTPREQITCKACGIYGHYVTECPYLPSFLSREIALCVRGWCARCLQQSHYGCCSRNTPNCYYCRNTGRNANGHHSALCPFQFPHF